MEKRGTLTRVIAIIGTIAVWIPLLAPLIFAVVHYFVTKRFLFDYLMPAELGLLALGGACALLWAALRSKLRVKWIAWAFGIAVFLLFGSQLLAVVTGLADGSTPMGGWEWAVVLGMLIGYILALIALGIGGILLIRDLRKH